MARDFTSFRVSEDPKVRAVHGDALSVLRALPDGCAYQSAEWLRREYSERLRSSGEIAAQFGITSNAVLSWLCKHGIARRTGADAQHVRLWGGLDRPARTEKTCRECGVTKPLSGFYNSRAHKGDGRTSRCADCLRAKSARRRQSPRGRAMYRAWQRRRVESGKHAAVLRAWRRTESGRAACARYRARPETKASWRKYATSEKGRATKREGARRRRAADPEAARAKWRRDNRRPSAKAAQARYWDSARGQEVKRAIRARYKRSPVGLEAARRNNIRRMLRLRDVVCTMTAAAWEEIKERHGGACVYCGRTDRRLTQDHVIPLSRGGHHTPENVVPACRECNSRKGTRAIPLVER